MRTRSLTLAGAIAVLGCTAVTTPALAADGTTQSTAQAPSAQTSGLLDGLLGGTGGLGGLLGGLLGGEQQAPLQDLLRTLLGGQAPTGTLLAPVQRLLDEVAATPGLPPATKSLIEQVRSLLASGGAGPLDGSVLLPVATLLRDLAGTQGIPGEARALLEQLADALAGDGSVGGLPLEALALPADLVQRLGGILLALENGSEPTGELLAPVAQLLDQVASEPGLPPAVGELLRQLGATLASTTGALDPLLASQIRLALRTIAGTPGVSTETRTVIERISTLLVPAAAAGGGGGAGAGAGAGGPGGPGASARTATKRDRAVVKRVRVNRARTVIAVRIACPRSAPATCATVVRATLAGRKAAQGKRVRIGAGRSKLVRLTMAPAARTASVRDGGRLRVRVTTSFGSKRFAAAKAIRLKASTR